MPIREKFYKYFVQNFGNVTFQLYIKTLVAIIIVSTAIDNTAQKIKFSLKDFFRFPADLVTFSEEILNGKLHFWCSLTSILFFHCQESNA